MSKSRDIEVVLEEWYQKEMELAQNIKPAGSKSAKDYLYEADRQEAYRIFQREEDRIYRKIFDSHNGVLPGYEGIKGQQRYRAESDGRDLAFDIKNPPSIHSTFQKEKEILLSSFSDPDACLRFIYDLQTIDQKVTCSRAKCADNTHWLVDGNKVCCSLCKESYRPLLKTMFGSRKTSIEKICFFVDLFDQDTLKKVSVDDGKDVVQSPSTVKNYIRSIARKRIEFCDAHTHTDFDSIYERRKAWYKWVFARSSLS